MKGHFKKIVSSLIYPPVCLHCTKLIEGTATLVCAECMPFFELISSEGRCRFCFEEFPGKGACKKCREKRRWHLPVAAAFERRGPVNTVVKTLQQGHLPYIAKALAGFMALQLEFLSWPMPDYIVPLSTNPIKTLLKGKSGSSLLALELSQLLDRPVKKRKIADKNILLVSDVLDERVHSYAIKLYGAYPRKIWSISLSV